MKARTFDRLTTEVARRQTRRSLLGVLAGGLIAGLRAHHRITPAHAAQRPDRDGDGLYDDDEVEVYGTNPDVFDTDGDGVGDGEEVYLGTDPRTPAGGNGGCPEGQAACGGVCIDITADSANCGGCGFVCAGGESCSSGVCLAPAPSSDLKCAAQGLTNCGGYCSNTYSDSANCGTCGNSCAPGAICSSGVCQGGCLVLGSQCVYGVNECCGGACLNGICQCSPSRDVCSNGGTCCSGACGSDGFCV
jgi:hypothetical protein